MRRRKGGEEKRAMDTVFGRKKLLDAKGPFGGKVIKNPARYTS